MRRQSNNSAPFSLFAFQDIITSTTGILILIVILITLSLVNSFAQPPQQQTKDLTEQLKAVLVETKGEIERRQKELQSNSTELQQVTVYTPKQLEEARLVTNRQLKRFETELIQVTSRLEKTKQDDKKWDTRLENQRAIYEQQRRELEKLQAELIRKKRENSELQVDLTRKNREYSDLQRRELEKLQAEITRKTRELDEADRLLTSNKARLAETRPVQRIFYNTSPPSGKVAWLVQIDGSQILVARAGINKKPIAIRPPDAEDFFVKMKELEMDPTRDYFFLVLRPGNVEAFKAIRERLRILEYDLGVELLEGHQFAVDPVTGGGIQ